MRRRHFRSGCGLCRLLAAYAFVAGAQLPADARAQRSAPIATLFAAGPHVTVNGRPAASGMEISSGDRVTTGSASSAKVNLYHGGSVQLDANTDPDVYDRSDPAFWQGLYVESREYLRCLTRVVLNIGQIYVEGEGETSCVSHGRATMIPRSRFNLQVAPGRELLTVTSGEVAIAGVQPITVARGTQVSIAGGRIIEQRRVGPKELRRVAMWRNQYSFARAAPSPRTPPAASRPAPLEPLSRTPPPAAASRPASPTPSPHPPRRIWRAPL